MALPHVISNVHMKNPHSFKRFHIIGKHEAPMYEMDLCFFASTGREVNSCAGFVLKFVIKSSITRKVLKEEGFSK